jgi:hypothetical protein
MFRSLSLAVSPVAEGAPGGDQEMRSDGDISGDVRSSAEQFDSATATIGFHPVRAARTRCRSFLSGLGASPLFA